MQGRLLLKYNLLGWTECCMRCILLWMIKIYIKLISPLLPPRCRFYPSCSQYCFDAIQKYGTSQGLIISLQRILRCHPFNEGGFDPLPEITWVEGYKNKGGPE